MLSGSTDLGVENVPLLGRISAAGSSPLIIALLSSSAHSLLGSDL